MSFGAYYEPETVALLSAVVNAALADLETKEAKSISEEKKSKITAALTKNLLAAFNSGQRDPRRLKALALNEYGT